MVVNGIPHVIEVNTTPGFSPASIVPQMIQADNNTITNFWQEILEVESISFLATAAAVTYVGAKPIFVDIKENDWLINAKKIQEKSFNETCLLIENKILHICLFFIFIFLFKG